MVVDSEGLGCQTDLGDRSRRYSPVLHSPSQVEVGTVVEGAAAKQFLQRKTRMLQLRLTRSLIEAIFVNAISRVSIDLVKKHGIMVGLVDAI